MDLLRELKRWLNTYTNLSARDWLVVAVSGGPDSLALLHLCQRLQPYGGPQIHVAHYDHQLRGEQSAAEARFVVETASAWGLTISCGQMPPPEPGHNLHDVARQHRYQFLAEAARAVGATAVATAHHADDQAETVLFHLLRGAGPAGLRGMPPVSPWPYPLPYTLQLLRPLLSITHQQLVDYGVAQQLTPCEDPSNQQLRYTRSRIRQELLPLLRSYNPQIVSSLGHTATIQGDIHTYLENQLLAIWPQLAHISHHEVVFDGQQWANLPVVLQREALRYAWRLLAPEAELSWERVEALRLAIMNRRGGARIELGGGVSGVIGRRGAFSLGYDP